MDHSPEPIANSRPSVLRQTCTYPSFSQQPTQTLTPLSAARSESVILTVQSNSSFLYRLTIWFMALMLRSGPGCEKRRNHSIITFNGFIPLPQQRCCPGMAPECCLVSGSACFRRMMERSGRLDSKGTRRAGGESTVLFHLFPSY